VLQFLRRALDGRVTRSRERRLCVDVVEIPGALQIGHVDVVVQAVRE